MNAFDDLDSLSDLLGLVGITADPDDISEWTKHQQEQASKWAAKTHLSASDNNVRVPPMPAFLELYKDA
jgi:hypothetical protein